MYFYKTQPLVIFLSALLVFAACKKSSDPGPAPVTDPLTTAAAKPGDTIIIKGQNFSEVAANNTVKFNGITATVVSATTTELKVVIPANATSGAVTVTVNGVTTEVGSLVLAPPTLYCVKMDTVTNAPEQLVAIDPANGKETAIASMGEIPEYAMPDIVYLAATNEVIYLNDSATGLIKINVTTKQTSTVRLAGTGYVVRCEALTTDKSGNLYAIKYDGSNSNNYITSLVKVDPQTGALTTIKSLSNNPVHMEYTVHLSSTNEIVGTSEWGRLFKWNLTTKDTSAIQLQSSNYESYIGLVADKQGNLLSFKYITDPVTYEWTEQIVQINTVTGAQTVNTTTKGVELYEGTISFLPDRNELYGILGHHDKLYKFNIGTKTTEVITLTTQPNFWYYKVTNN